MTKIDLHARTYLQYHFSEEPLIAHNVMTKSDLHAHNVTKSDSHEPESEACQKTVGGEDAWQVACEAERLNKQLVVSKLLSKLANALYIG